MRKKNRLFCGWKSCLFLSFVLFTVSGFASSHREAPLISNDPLADNTDVYAFRSPDDPNTVTIIANYIPFESPEGGPNWYTFGNDIRYEIHIKNKSANPSTDDITYRFTFTTVDEDPSTFFRIRLGKENWKTSYTCEKSTDGGQTFVTIVSKGLVPPPNIGPRSIEGLAGLNTDYNALMMNAIVSTSSGEKLFCGPVDDPFFVDLAGAFDVGSFRPQGNPVNPSKDGLARFNVHTIALKIPISHLQKDGKSASQAASILDPDFVIGVWASASRRQIKTFANNTANYTGNWVQVSRLGMPLTNEAVIPAGTKDKWNTVYSNNGDAQFEQYFVNPELALYMDDSKFGGAVPALSDLRIQSNSLGQFDFRNGRPGLYPLKGTSAVAGTALDDAVFGNYLLRPAAPRSVDLLPLFHTGVPNLRPYQLATGKNGNPLAAGKPFVNNFLPTFGDMLRLNMAVPATPRTSADFSSLGLLQAAVLGLTDPRFNTNKDVQAIPNMDGFPNGRRLEDDVTTIELQAVSGVVLAAIGLFYDDYSGSGSPLTPQLQKVLAFTAGPTHNDTTLKTTFPYVQSPWRGFTGAQYAGAVACTPPTFLNDRTIVLDATCGLHDGNISIIPTNGTAPFLYSIDGGATYLSGPNAGYTFMGLAPGTYKLRLKDGNGCESAVAERVVHSVFYGTPFRNDQTIVLDASCSMNDGAISIIPTNGSEPFLYSIDGGATYVSGPASGYTFQNLKAGTYQLRLKDSRGCESYVVVRDVRPDFYGSCATNGSPMTAHPNTPVVNTDRGVSVQAYPNPSRGKFRLQLKNLVSPNAQISVLDDKGRLLQNKLVNTQEGNTFDFDLSHQAKGVYLIRVVSDKGVQLSKIVIQ